MNYKKFFSFPKLMSEKFIDLFIEIYGLSSMLCGLLMFILIFFKSYYLITIYSIGLIPAFIISSIVNIDNKSMRTSIMFMWPPVLVTFFLINVEVVLHNIFASISNFQNFIHNKLQPKETEFQVRIDEDICPPKDALDDFDERLKNASR